MLHLALKNGVTSAVTNQQRAVCSTPFIFIDQLNRFIDNPDTTVILYDNSVWPHFIVICKYLHIVVQNEQTTEWVHILYVPMWKLGLCNITYVGCITPILSTFFEPNTSLKGWISIGLDSNFPLWFTDMLYATNMIHIGEHYMDVHVNTEQNYIYIYIYNVKINESWKNSHGNKWIICKNHRKIDWSYVKIT